jgi:hypothetical protein
VNQPRASSGPGPAFRTALAILAFTGLCTVAYFLFTGASYYLTPVGERARHPQYWDLKPGGELGLRFGAIGLAMMTVMHAYSARKRLRPLRGMGPLRSWLSVHILLGVLGPLFVVLHSSFKVGGLVSISFWAMVAVALSGVFGRYLYLQIPRTRAGEELSLAEVERNDRDLTARLRDEFGADDAFLERLAQATLPPPSRGTLGALFRLILLDIGLGRPPLADLVASLPHLTPQIARELTVVVREKARLRRRIATWDAMHRVFHYWHVAHKPFAIVMYVFVVVHVAVAALAGYAWR